LAGTTARIEPLLADETVPRAKMDSTVFIDLTSAAVHTARGEHVVAFQQSDSPDSTSAGGGRVTSQIFM
jgi:hypothetical protein